MYLTGGENTKRSKDTLLFTLHVVHARMLWYSVYAIKLLELSAVHTNVVSYSSSYCQLTVSHTPTLALTFAHTQLTTHLLSPNLPAHSSTAHSSKLACTHTLAHTHFFEPVICFDCKKPCRRDRQWTCSGTAPSAPLEPYG